MMWTDTLYIQRLYVGNIDVDFKMADFLPLSL